MDSVVIKSQPFLPAPGVFNFLCCLGPSCRAQSLVVVVERCLFTSVCRTLAAVPFVAEFVSMLFCFEGSAVTAGCKGANVLFSAYLILSEEMFSIKRNENRSSSYSL